MDCTQLREKAGQTEANTCTPVAPKQRPQDYVTGFGINTSGVEVKGGSDLIDKVVKKEHKDLGIQAGSTTNRQTRRIAQTWIGNNCIVQWLIVDDPQLRCWAEHYMLSILRPVWGQ